AAGAGAVNVLASPLLFSSRAFIFHRLAALRLPAVYQFPEMAEQGGLIGYGPLLVQLFRDIVSRQLAKLLRGSKPDDLPVEQPTKFALVINLRTAKAMDHELLTEFLSRADEVIGCCEALTPCLIGMEACATAHYWARELTKLGHEVRLMPAKDVKAYVKRNKNDAADAEAICEAVRRPTMRFVGVKSAEQQGQLMQHRTRDLLMRQRTQSINALRAHLAELGITAAQGREGIR